jgi:para-aminobenzoate synthetase/4-amino-4-deoxychorismate lyase
MKGTAARALTPGEDRRRRDDLCESAKQRAENVMIVDMVRNDLARVAEIGSVRVPELHTVERYPNIWQMTSLVACRSTASLDELFAALYPAASVTGAPKFRTMEILRTLERQPRGVYTGAIGHIAPDGNGSFNVAIRTAVIDEHTGEIEFGVGSGIVRDSDAASEYAACLLKGSVMGRRPQRFELLETIRWTPAEGFFLLDRHLERLHDSAEYFSFACDLNAVRKFLKDEAAGWRDPRRVRLLLDRDGSIRAEHSALLPGQQPLRVVLASTPVDPADLWLFHKTTNRAVYEHARDEGRGFDEVILWNPQGQVTEASTANVVVEIDGRRVTPPVECGLLAGTYRAEMLKRSEISEQVVTVDDLRAAPRLWLINSVHGSREAVLAGRRVSSSPRADA